MYKKPKCSSFDELELLKSKIKEKASKEFDLLVSSLEIDLQKNKDWADNYYSLINETKKLSKSINRLSVWKWLLLIPLIFPFFIMNCTQKKKKALLDEKNKQLIEPKNNLQKQLNVFRSKLTYDLAFNNIINYVWEDINLDLYLNDKEACNWEHDYLQYMPSSSCATSLVSGRLFNHPFVLMNRKDLRWQPHVYVGSIPVTYKVTINGKTETRSVVVTATITKPEPAWSFTPYFLYRASKPFDLTFCNDLSKNEVKKKVKNLQQQNLENSEFNKLFQASRNDEKEYRVVFTPLAQEGFVKLFKQRKYHIEKEKEVISISSPMNLIDNDFSDDVNFNLELWKEKYVDWISRLIDSIGTFSLPIANMPVFFQMPYSEHNKEALSRIRYQDIANWIIDKYNLWDNFETNATFECKSYRKINVENYKFTCVQILCNYFHPNCHMQMVPTQGPNGIVAVPVEVIDYLGRSKDLFIYVAENNKFKDKEIIENGYAIHSGQLIIWSWTTISPKQLSEIVKNL